MRYLSLFLLILLVSCSTSKKESSNSIARDAFEKIDIHAHYRAERLFLNQVLDEWKMQAQLVDVVRTDSSGVKRSFSFYQTHEAKHPDRFFLCSGFNAYGIDDPEFAENIIAQLDAEISAGARMVKVWKNIGMVDKDKTGNYVQIDDPRFQPIWDFLIKKKIPVVAHIGEPLQAWRPLEDGNPHHNYFKNHPQYHAYHHEEIPRYETIMEARDNWLANNPKLTVLAAHMGSMSHDVDEVAMRLDKFPNLYVEPAARFGDITRQNSEKVRAFILKYQDRMLYGTDLGSSGIESEKSVDELAGEEKFLRRLLELHWEYFSGTDSLYYDSPMISFPVNTHSLALPESVLRKLYYGNAAKLLKINP